MEHIQHNRYELRLTRHSFSFLVEHRARGVNGSERRDERTKEREIDGRDEWRWSGGAVTMRQRARAIVVGDPSYTAFRVWARMGRNEAASGEESASERVVGGCFVACVYACGTHSSWSTALRRNMIQTKAALENSLTLNVVVAWRATRARSCAKNAALDGTGSISSLLLEHLSGG